MFGKNKMEHTLSNLQKSNLVIILVDSSSKIDEIKEIMKMEKPVIISFDYDSHKMLLDNGIDHELSDNYLNETDLQNIQKNSYTLSKWYAQTKISRMLEYHKVNLGYLLEVEFSSFLVKFLKQFVELSRILKKYPSGKFVTSLTLYEIIKPMTEKVESFGTQIDGSLFFYDQIKYPIKFRNHSYTFNIPRHYFLKLKNFLDSVLHFLFGFKTAQSHSKSVLLIEFDPIRFKTLFSILYKSPLNFVLFNRRRPAIWNFESFKIIKNSKCKIATNYSLENELKDKIKQDLVLTRTKINSVLNNEKSLEIFFTISGTSFWNSMKVLFTELFNKRIEEYVTEIETTRQLLMKQRFSCIVIWSEVGLTEKIVIQLAKENQIPIVLIQHGIFYDTPEAYDMSESQGAFPKDVDKYVVWGKLESENAIRYGVDPKKIEILGAPQYDHTIDLQNENLHRDFILVATSGFSKEDVHGLTVETTIRYEEIISKICKVASDMNKKLIIKLHPALEEPIDFIALAKKINPSIVVVKTGSITPLLKCCDVVVTIDLTSVVLEAQLYKKPVISVALQNWWGMPKIFGSNYCLRTDIDGIGDLLNKVLTDYDFRNQLIGKGTMFVNNYLSNIGKASTKVLDMIDKMTM